MPLFYAYYSPNAGIAAYIASAIVNAYDHIDIMAHEYQSGPIHAALLTARSNGVAVRLILDRRQLFISAPYVTQLRAAGAQVRFDKKHPAMHSNVFTADGYVTGIGSFPYTEAADLKNVDHWIYVDDTFLADSTTADFEIHWAHSVEQ